LLDLFLESAALAHAGAQLPMDPLNFQSVWANHILVCCNCPQMLQDMEAGEDDMEDDAD